MMKSLLFTILFCLILSHSAFAEITYYIKDRGGSDNFTGTTPATAFRTLDRVHQILHNERPTDDVRIIILQGHYYCREMKVPWTYFNYPYTVTIEGAQVHNRRATFYGHDANNKRCDRSVWLWIKHSKIATGLTISNLTIKNYRGAISIEGRANEPSRTDNGIKIVGNIFEKIGDAHYTSSAVGKGAILLRNTFGNIISGNIFSEIQNKYETRGLIHGVYFRSMSHRNQVVANKFIDISGSAIKLTDYSNENRFYRNTFEKTTWAIVDRWCGAKEDPTTACGNAEPQCPSWGNKFDLSTNNRNYVGPNVRSVWVAEIPEGQTCRYPPSATRPRMYM